MIKVLTIPKDCPGFIVDILTTIIEFYALCFSNLRVYWLTFDVTIGTSYFLSFLVFFILTLYNPGY